MIATVLSFEKVNHMLTSGINRNWICSYVNEVQQVLLESYVELLVDSVSQKARRNTMMINILLGEKGITNTKNKTDDYDGDEEEEDTNNNYIKITTKNDDHDDGDDEDDKSYKSLPLPLLSFLLLSLSFIKLFGD